MVALSFLLTQNMYLYRVSQYTWGPCDCPLISAHSIYIYRERGVSIYMGLTWLPYHFCLLRIYIYIGCLNIHGAHVTALLFLLTQYIYIYIERERGVSIYMGLTWLPYHFCLLRIYIYIGCLNIHGAHVTALLFLLTQYIYIYIERERCLNIHGAHMVALSFLLTQNIYLYRVSQYTWGPCDC